MGNRPDTKGPPFCHPTCDVPGVVKSIHDGGRIVGARVLGDEEMKSY